MGLARSIQSYVNKGQTLNIIGAKPIQETKRQSPRAIMRSPKGNANKPA